MELVKKLQTESVPKLILSLAAPAILSLMLGALNSAIDALFVSGGIGEDALAAVTASLGVTLILQAFSLLVAAGTAAALALRLGRGDSAGAERILGCAFSLALLLALCLTVLGLCAARPLLTLYGAQGQTLVLALRYTRVIIGGCVFFVLAQVANNALKGMGYAKRALVYFASSAALNIALNFVFICLFGWGMYGAALSTVLGNALCALLALRFLRSHGCTVRLQARNMPLVRTYAAAILSVGLPACIMQLALSLAALAFNHAAAQWGGTTAVAAYGIVYNISMLVYMPVMGLGQGIQPILGLNYSAGNYPRVHKTLRCAVIYASIFCTAMFALTLLLSPQIAGAFGGMANPTLAATGTHGLRLFCLTLPVIGFEMILANYFQYVGKVRQAVILSMLRQLVLVIPLVLILPHFWGVTGIWLATPLADFIALCVTLVFAWHEMRFLRVHMQNAPAANTAV